MAVDSFTQNATAEYKIKKIFFFFWRGHNDMTRFDARFQLFHPFGHSEWSIIISYGTCWALLHGLKLNARREKNGLRLPPKDDEVHRQQWGLHRVCGPGARGSFPHATPWFGSEEVSASSRGMKCLSIVLLNYYVLNITMTKVPLDFSSIQLAEGPLSPL